MENLFQIKMVGANVNIIYLSVPKRHILFLWVILHDFCVVDKYFFVGIIPGYKSMSMFHIKPLDYPRYFRFYHFFWLFWVENYFRAANI